MSDFNNQTLFIMASFFPFFILIQGFEIDITHIVNYNIFDVSYLKNNNKVMN